MLFLCGLVNWEFIREVQNAKRKVQNERNCVAKIPPLSQMLRICQLPLKGGAQYNLPPGGEGVTVR